jgi:hypothetical protein
MPRDRTRVSFKDEGNHAVIQQAVLFPMIIFGIPNVVSFIRTAVGRSLHRDKMNWIFIA